VFAPMLPKPDQHGHESGPASLMAGAQSGAVIAVEVLVEKEVIAPVRIGLENLRTAVHRTLTMLVAPEDACKPRGEVLGHLEPSGGHDEQVTFGFGVAFAACPCVAASSGGASGASAVPGTVASGARRSARASTDLASTRHKAAVVRMIRCVEIRIRPDGQTPCHNASRSPGARYTGPVLAIREPDAAGFLTAPMPVPPLERSASEISDAGGLILDPPAAWQCGNRDFSGRARARRLHRYSLSFRLGWRKEEL
jgi:hypothetical protein